MPQGTNEPRTELFIVFTSLGAPPLGLKAVLPQDFDHNRRTSLVITNLKFGICEPTGECAYPSVVVRSDHHGIPQQVVAWALGCDTVRVVKHENGKQAHIDSVKDLAHSFRRDRLLIASQNHTESGQAAQALNAFFTDNGENHATRFERLLDALRSSSYSDSRSNDASDLNAHLASLLAQQGGWGTFKAEVMSGKLQKCWEALRLDRDIEQMDPDNLKTILKSLTLPCAKSSSS